MLCVLEAEAEISGVSARFCGQIWKKRPLISIRVFYNRLEFFEAIFRLSIEIKMEI